jgi:glycosyltransferase involved in cell wall biosynthesis
MKRLKVLISAYACEPGKGSEPGVGWNVAREMAKYHDIWVITRANNREVIEAELARNPQPNLHFIYYDLPQWAKWWKKDGRGVQLYYYLWQIGIYFVARKLHQDIEFDLAHHVTFVKYWSPSFISLLPIPFIWGPVGGGESAPKAFWSDFSPAGQHYEMKRDIARWLGEHDPFVRLTARRSVLALATTEDTEERLVALNARKVKVFSQVGFSVQEIQQFRVRESSVDSAFRLISIGNLLHWKGFHLGLRAFAEADLPDAEYWIVGDGPERQRLEELANSVGNAHCVKFFGKLPREETLEKLSQCHVLVHPSLHDSGGFVCLEAMAAGKPVICLDLGGPAVQVTEVTGFKIPAHTPDQVVADTAMAMKCLVQDENLRTRIGKAGQKRVCHEFSWNQKGEVLNSYHTELLLKQFRQN